MALCFGIQAVWRRCVVFCGLVLICCSVFGEIEVRWSSIVGEGTIEGFPSFGTTEPGVILDISAFPAEGWQFERWWGDFNSESANASVLIQPIPTSLNISPIFYQPIDGAPFGGRSYKLNWVYEEIEGTHNFSVDSAVDMYRIELQIGFEFTGPGTFSFETDESASLDVFLSGRELNSERVLREGNRYTIQVPEGSQTIALEASFSSLNELRDVRWSPGYTVDLQIVGRGTVEGDGAAERMWVSPGDILSLTAIPDAGYVFDRWLWNGIDPALELSVDRDLEVVAIFVESEVSEAIVDHPFLTRTSGNGLWRQEGEVWKSPLGLHRYANARLEGVATGPARIALTDLSGSDVGASVRLGLDGVRTAPDPDLGGLTWSIPEGEHRFYIEPAFDIGNQEYEVSFQLALQYPVSVASVGGAITASTGLVEQFPYDNNISRLEGWVALGESLSVEAVPGESGLNQFVSWSGDFEGKPAILDHIVEGPINAMARFGAAVSVGASETELTVSPSGRFFHYNWDESRYRAFPEAGTIILTGQLPGPGRLNIVTRYFDETELLVEGVSLGNERSSYYAELEAGSQKVEIRLSLENGQSLDAIRDSNGFPEFWIDYAEGYWLKTEVLSGRGRVEVLSQPDVLLEGGNIQVQATPSFGYEFAGWGAPHASQPQGFSFAFSAEEAVLAANFDIISTHRGFEWNFTGRAPFFYDESGWRPRGSVGLSINSENPLASASAVIEGPGMLDMTMDRYAASEGERIVAINGVEYPVIETGEYSFPLLAGPNEVVFIARGGDEIPYARTQYFGWPEVRTLYRIEASSPWVDPVLSLSEEARLYGAVISIEGGAPPEGVDFVGWRNVKTNEFVSDNPIYEYVVTEDLSLEALYSPLGIRLEDWVAYTDSNAWTSEKSLEAAEMDDTIVASETNRKLHFHALKPARLQFEYEPQENEQLSIQRNGVEVARSGLIRLGKESYSVFADKDDVVSFVFYQIGSGERPRISKIESVPDWGPTLAIRGEGAVEFEIGEDTYQAFVPDFHKDRFVGWGYWRTDSITPFEIGAYDLVEAAFYALVPEIEGVDDLTVVGLQKDELGGWTHISNGSGALEFGVDGPVVLRIGEFSSVDVYIDGERIRSPVFLGNLQSQLPDEDRFLYPIDEGAHNVKILVEQNRILSSVRVSSGCLVYPYWDIDSQVSISLTPNSIFNALGSELLVQASHSRTDFEFLDWEGEQSGNPASFTMNVAGHTELNPIFLPAADHPDNRILSGGGVLVVPDYSAWYQKLDGEVIHEIENAREIGYYQVVPLSEEEHILTLESPYSHGAYVHDADGVVGQVFGQGVDVRVLPEREGRVYFQKGEQITIKVQGAQAELVDWSGLPESAIVSEDGATFVVDETFLIVASVPQRLSFFGVPVELEGAKVVNFGPWYEFYSADGPINTLIRFKATEPGWLIYELKEPSRISVNGQAISPVPYGLHVSKGRVYVVEGDVIEIDYTPDVEAYQTVNQFIQVAVYDFAFEPVTIGESEFLSWWNSHGGSLVGSDILFDLDVDVDGDGLSLLREFELGTDPWKRNRFIWTEAFEANDGLFSVTRSLPEGGKAEDILFEWSLSPLGPWRPIDEVLSLAGPAPGATVREQWSGEIDPSGVFFRATVDVETESRTIGQLLGLDGLD